MAIKKYRVLYGNHTIPNPNFIQDPATGIIKTPEVQSHVYAEAGEVIELEEARASVFCRTGPGLTPKLAEVSDSAGIPEITTEVPDPKTQPRPQQQFTTPAKVPVTV